MVEICYFSDFMVGRWRSLLVLSFQKHVVAGPQVTYNIVRQPGIPRQHGISTIILHRKSYLLLFLNQSQNSSMYIIIRFYFYFRLAFKGLKLLFTCKHMVKFFDWTVISLFRRCVAKYPKNVMMVNAANDEEWTYTEVMFLLDHHNKMT